MTELPSAAKQILILANPSAGSRRRATAVAELDRRLAGAGFQVSVVERFDDLVEQAERSAAEGRLRCVVAAGGDGTIAEVANRTPAGTPLLPFPLGTENLLAKYLGLRADAELLTRVIAQGRLVSLDAGQAGGRLFLLMASSGYDAEVVRRLHGSRRGNIKHLSYAQPIWRSIRSYQYPEMRVYCEPSETPAEDEYFLARWVFLFNLPCYARGLGLARLANGFDGQLNLCAFRRGSLASGLYYLTHILRGTHERLPDCTVRRVKRVRLESDVEVPWQMDGDPGGMLPLTVECQAARLTLLVPPAWRGDECEPEAF